MSEIYWGHLILHKNTKQLTLNPIQYSIKPLPTYCDFSKLTFTFNPVKKLGQTQVVYKRLEIELVCMCVKLKKEEVGNGEKERTLYLPSWKKFCIFQFVVQVEWMTESIPTKTPKELWLA